jgi:hypothetical protein
MQEWGERGEAERKAFLAYLAGEQTHRFSWRDWIAILAAGVFQILQMWAMLRFLFD